MKYTRYILFTILPALLLFIAGCVETDRLESRLDELELKADELQDYVATINENTILLKYFLSGKVYITDFKDVPGEGYTLSLSDSTSVVITTGSTAHKIVPIIGVDENGAWTMSVDGGESFSAIEGCSGAFDKYGKTPQLSISSDGFWMYSIDGGQSTVQVLDKNGLPISATDGRQVAGAYSFFKALTKDEETSTVNITLLSGQTVSVPFVPDFSITLDGYSQGADIRLNETLAYPAGINGVQDVIIRVPDGWRMELSDTEAHVSAPSDGKAGEYTISLLATSLKGILKEFTYKFNLKDQDVDFSTCKPWNDFVSGSADNVLPDFSYSGYDHGESAPPEVETLGWKFYNVCDYGAVPNDNLSDRQALIDCLTAAFGAPSYNTTKTHIIFNAGPYAGKVIYFPEGEFIVHTSADDVLVNEDGHPDSQAIRITGGGFAIKGAGRGKTRLVIKDMLLPSTHDTYVNPSAGMYSSAWLFVLGLQNSADVAADTKYTNGLKVTSDAKKGDFNLTLSSVSGLSKGSWICIRAIINETDYIRSELKNLPTGPTWDILSTGISLREYHQIVKIEGKKLTLAEPLLHDVIASKGFYAVNFAPNSEIGVEDITFVGQNVNDFVHHGSWIPDGAYKPLEFQDVVNSWLRRCDFESVSEICNFAYCANCSIYDLKLSGWRGHNNARVGRGSFNFYGKVIDTSDGLTHTSPLYSAKTTLEGAGSFHGPGVSYESCSTVFWRCQWGKDAGFESHGRQSHTNLWDACSGGFLSCRQGGGTDDMPNHMGGLVFWNFNSFNDWVGFDWWSNQTSMYVVQPIIVGMHGGNVTSVPGFVTMDYSNGTPVDVESLYEAQLRHRLGYVPLWLTSLK